MSSYFTGNFLLIGESRSQDFFLRAVFRDSDSGAIFYENEEKLRGVLAGLNFSDEAFSQALEREIPAAIALAQLQAILIHLNGNPEGPLCLPKAELTAIYPRGFWRGENLLGAHPWAVEEILTQTPASLSAPCPE